jgi:hypothetical protein
MDCLQYFNGWTNPNEKAEEHIRGLVSKLKLRPLGEPGDVDSALLRSQIDEQYLQAMVSARAQMAGVGLEQEGRHNKGHSSRHRDNTPDAKSKQSILPSQSMAGPPPAYPRPNASPASYRAQPHMHGASPAAMGRPRWGYPPQHGQWWGNGYHPHPPYPYRDDASVHSALSGDTSFQQQYDPNMSGYPGAMHHPHYYHPMMYPQHQMLPGQPQGVYDPSMQDPSTYGLEGCNPEQFAAMDWGGQPHMGHMPPQSSTPSLPGTPGAPLPVQDMPAYTDSQANTHLVPADQTPYKYNPNQVPMSPYWGHLDHATLAMMGIATPQGPSAPQTPARGVNPSSTEDRGDVESKPESHGAAGNAQPLLLRQQYYGYGVSPARSSALALVDAGNLTLTCFFPIISVWQPGGLWSPIPCNSIHDVASGQFRLQLRIRRLPQSQWFSKERHEVQSKRCKEHSHGGRRRSPSISHATFQQKAGKPSNS